MDVNLLQYGLSVIVGLFSIGAITSLVFQKFPRVSNMASCGFASLASCIGIGWSLWVMLGERTYSFVFTTTIPLLDISLRVDPFAAFFMLITSTIAFCASLYGMGYMTHYYGVYNIGAFGFFYNLFIASMLLVFSAQQALYFLLVWEVMSLTSYVLVTFEHHNEESIRAGFTYFAMTQAGSACIIFAFLLLYQATGSFNFDTFRQGAPLLSASIQISVLLLALVGFGTKAGIIPFHVWLPKAHPAAPSHVSALMSGVMIKTGVFMLIRFFIEFTKIPPLWCGVTFIIIGASSAFLGVLYALTANDIKRLLAYSSIENIGIIFLGFGAALVFGSQGQSTLMTLALAAALYHTANHAVFKSLLFLGAGSVVQATHTRAMEKMGGLIKNMPVTAACFLVGSLAISGMPPFNGFVSEWLTFHSLFAGVLPTNIALTFVFIAAIASLVFTGGLAAVCFVKAFGIPFLAKARSTHAEHVRESSPSMRFGMGFLAVLCLLLGVGAGDIMPVLSRVARSISSVYGDAPMITSPAFPLGASGQFSLPSMLSIGVLMMSLFTIVVIVVWCATFKRKLTRSITWDCGSPLSTRTEITANGFSRSLLTIFKSLVHQTKKIDVRYADSRGYVPMARTVTLGITDVYEERMYGPMQKFVERVSYIVKKIQSGNVNLYILYIGAVLAALFFWISLP